MADVEPQPFGRAVDQIEMARAQEYALLSTLLLRSPDADLLLRLRRLRGDESALGRAHQALAESAARTDAEQVAREYFALFVGVGRGELLPYASYYLTGFVHGRPLVALRQDLQRLGIERAEGQSEPEDHAAILLEVMGALAGGIVPAPAGADRAFFHDHLAPWIAGLFSDLERANAAHFYSAVGQLGTTFMEIERKGFQLTDSE